MLGLAAGLALLARLDAVSPLEMVVVALAIIGLGSGTFITPNTAAMMAAAPRARQGTAAAIQAIARYVGFAMGTALASSSLVGTSGSPDALAGALRAGLSIAAAAAVAAALLVFVGAARSPGHDPQGDERG